MSVESSVPQPQDSAPRGAVFLSYASQDADAARRIAEFLRASGVEVWFDQSELVGGDAWDQKIRKQIKDCALLIPIISAATQARTEGYFRLEWRLADQRTHLMAKGRPFLLPVVIDDTRDADAHVPDSFTEVQWTRLRPAGYAGQARPGDATQGGPVLDDASVAAFCARVKKLLGGDLVGAASAAIESRGPAREHRDPAAHAAGYIAAEAAPKRKPPWLMPVIVGSVAIAVATVWLTRDPAPAPVAVATAASAELARVRARIIPDRWQREDYAAVSATLDRLIKDNPEESDAWALRSIINSLQVVRNFDAGTRPLEIGKSDADRARRLAPGSPLADLAFGLHLGAMASRGSDAAACRPYIDRAVAALPPDALTRYAELVSYWFGYEFEDVHRVAMAWLAAEPHASFPAWILSQSCFVQRQPDEAEKWAEQAAVDSGITGVRAHYTRFESNYYLRADVRAAREELGKVPAAGRTVHRVVHAHWLMAMVERRWDDALQELVRVPEPMLFDRSYHGPKALLAGLAHLRAGRTEAAAAQFREAERLLREQLAADPDNEGLHGVLAVVLAYGGRGAEARNELALFEPLVKGRAPTLQRGSLALLIAQTYAVLGDSVNLAYWLRRLLDEPSQFAFTPAAIRLDPRFAGATDAPEIVALLTEFAGLDQKSKVGGQRSDDPSLPQSLTPADRPSAANPKSVAVLAFANLSDDKGNEYFSDGISEELLNVLAKIHGLKVSARTSAFYFKGKQVPLAEIAQQLGVAYVVEGSVRKAGDRVRISAQLIKASDGFQMWSENFDRDLKDIFAVQDEIAGLVAQNLQLKLGVSTPHEPVDPEAFRLFLESRRVWSGRTPTAMDEAERLLTRALDRAPGFARGLAAMADVWWFRGHEAGADPQKRSREDLLRTAETWLDRAMAADPNLAEAYATRGVILSDQNNSRGAETALRRALELNPNYASAHQWYGGLLFDRGEIERGLRELEMAVQLDPLAPMISSNHGVCLHRARRYAEALAAFDRVLAMTPDFGQALGWRPAALYRSGRQAEAIPLVRERLLVSDAAGRPGEGYMEQLVVLAESGDKEEAAHRLDRLESAYPEANGWGAELLIVLGRKEEALARLAESGPGSIVEFLNPVWDPVRESPEFLQLIEKVGITAIYQKAWAQVQVSHENPTKP